MKLFGHKIYSAIPKILTYQENDNKDSYKMELLGHKIYFAFLNTST